MIGKIRRMISRSAWPDDLDAEWPGDGSALVDEGETVLLSPPRTSPEYTSELRADDVGYYAGLVSAALSQNGEFRGYRISPYWLRVTLAKLEGRDAMTEVIYGGEECAQQLTAENLTEWKETPDSASTADGRER